tara:strand:- start:1178 stop:2068 length:891 start_codon:yes stop_codon:yes gene_type:complete
MESKETKKGILIAFIGALLITPDTLFMRLSFMDVWTMLFWRGIQMGIVLILITICIKEYRKKFKEIFTKTGIYIILSQAIGSIFFTYGVATSSVALILLCIASSPLFASFFSYFLLKEKVKNSTIYASFFVIIGITISVLDAENAINIPDGNYVFGLVCGLITASTLGLNFVLLRSKPNIPAIGATGFGALLTGLIGALFIQKTNVFLGDLLAISISGIIILPLSFAALTYATRYTQAANVSLLMLLETILGPVWVWIIIDETPTFQMIAGGMIVIFTLLIYFLYDICKNKYSFNT